MLLTNHPYLKEPCDKYQRIAAEYEKILIFA